MTLNPNLYSDAGYGGQCTDECAKDVPEGTRYGVLGNALSWADNWARHGGAVSSNPHVGDIACFQPGSNGASHPNGHVGIVKSVTGIIFALEEENATAGP